MPRRLVKRAFWAHPVSRGALVVAYLIFVAASIYGSDRTHRAAVDAEHAVEEVQEQRATAVRLLCVETNARNVNTKAYLDTLPQSPNRAAIDALIDALVPVQDCDAAVARATGSG
jgi:hypothetical protein